MREGENSSCGCVPAVLAEIRGVTEQHDLLLGHTRTWLGPGSCTEPSSLTCVYLCWAEAAQGTMELSGRWQIPRGARDGIAGQIQQPDNPFSPHGVQFPSSLCWINGWYPKAFCNLRCQLGSPENGIELMPLLQLRAEHKEENHHSYELLKCRHSPALISSFFILFMADKEVGTLYVTSVKQWGSDLLCCYNKDNIPSTECFNESIAWTRAFWWQ